VQTATLEFCQAHSELPVTRLSPVGHLASVVTSDRPECDGSKHPWVVTGAHGQRVNLTLYDFTIDSQLVAITTLKTSQRCANRRRDKSPPPSVFGHWPDWPTSAVAHCRQHCCDAEPLPDKYALATDERTTVQCFVSRNVTFLLRAFLTYVT